MKLPTQCFEFNILLYVVVQISSCVFFIIYLSYEGIEACLNILYNFRIKKKKKKKKKEESENKNEGSLVQMKNDSDIDYETADQEGSPDINALWKKAKA